MALAISWRVRALVPDQRHDHAAQGLHILIGEFGPVQHGAQILRIVAAALSGG